MSLTSELEKRDSPVTHFFESHFDIATVRGDWKTRVASTETIRPDPTRRIPSTVGTALDYRLRYYFGATPIDELIAGKAMEKLVRAVGLPESGDPSSDGSVGAFGRPPESGVDAAELVGAFSTSLEGLVNEVRPSGRQLEQADDERLCRHCYVLALYEEFFRAGFTVRSPLYTLGAGASVSELLALPDAVWVEDLCRLSTTFYERCGELIGRPAALNPTFEGSAEIGGADADLIVDRCLIDVKTTVAPKLRKEMLYQLLGYVLLDYDDEYGIDSVAFYLSRQGIFIRWPLLPFLETLMETHNVSLADLRSAFRNAVWDARARSSRTTTPRAASDPGRHDG